MGKRTILDAAERKTYFEAEQLPPPDVEAGTREMAPLPPFVISGGRNTERYYFKHLSKVSQYKFIVKPEYFNDESNYTVAFPKRINEILAGNADAKVYCVFDWDTVYGNAVSMAKHRAFEKQFVSTQLLFGGCRI